MSIYTTAIFHPLARHVWALSSERLSACVDSAFRGYICFFYIRLLATFGPWAPNGYLLASIPPLGDIYIYIVIHLLAMFGPYAPNGYLASNPLFGLAASLAPHGDMPSALRPCPLTAICLWPCGLNRFSIQLTPNVEFFFLTPPHDKINFLFALR